MFRPPRGHMLWSDTCLITVRTQLYEIKTQYIKFYKIKTESATCFDPLGGTCRGVTRALSPSEHFHSMWNHHTTTANITSRKTPLPSSVNFFFKFEDLNSYSYKKKINLTNFNLEIYSKKYCICNIICTKCDICSIFNVYTSWLYLLYYTQFRQHNIKVKVTATCFDLSCN